MRQHGYLTWEARMKVLIGTAKALAYLHEAIEPKVVHRDIKSSNILIDDDFNAKSQDYHQEADLDQVEQRDSVCWQHPYFLLRENQKGEMMILQLKARSVYGTVLDINNAFLHGFLDEDIYVQQPHEFEDSSKLDHVFYVDDLILTRNLAIAIDKFLAALSNIFPLKVLGSLHYFIGIEAHSTATGLTLSQQRYITELLCHTHLDGAKPASTPMATSMKLSKFSGTSLADPTEYQSVVGALQYVTLTRPDISFVVNKVFQFLQSPTEEHCNVVKHALRYLKGTIDFDLHFRASDLVLTNYLDADWTSFPDDK
ncbi:PREDICTED: uncharacterized protein LOC109115785 [Nelumbo nucifera]|uniref:Uncharacterized protein LOC109115785 n=1 Tax=Nelumbo nucifera TaxID=4432 RepID=A0A1U8QAW4_NELNU|nr:PREDICTED: uncharacterized protein LOC109115785 [Nelumbo nucifera]